MRRAVAVAVAFVFLAPAAPAALAQSWADIDELAQRLVKEGLVSRADTDILWTLQVRGLPALAPDLATVLPRNHQFRGCRRHLRARHTTHHKLAPTIRRDCAGGAATCSLGGRDDLA